MIEKDWYSKNKDKFEKLSDKVRTILGDILDENKIEYHQVDSRTKTYESFSKKAENPKYNSETDITDISGIRIITYVEDTIPSICDLIETNFDIDKKNSLDKGEDLGLDKVGYKSVHYVANLPDSRTQLTENKKFKGLKFEIQVRTILQHSWAEIEHDRNYKFGGKLPSKIQRRFKLLAGLLELADNEFNSISNEIDEYSKDVKNKTQDGDLNISINSTSLQQYLNLKLSPYENIKFQTDVFINQGIVNELKNYGISTLAEFEKIIPVNLFNVYEKYNKKYTSIGVVRDVLLINDYKKYFAQSYNGGWGFYPTDNEDIEFFKEFKLTLKELIETMEKTVANNV